MENSDPKNGRIVYNADVWLKNEAPSSSTYTPD